MKAMKRSSLKKKPAALAWLSDELVEDILSRLPTESLFSCTSVSRRFCSLVINLLARRRKPKFGLLYYNRDPKLDLKLGFLKSSYDEQVGRGYNHILQRSFSVSKNAAAPSRILASSNGLLLFKGNGSSSNGGGMSFSNVKTRNASSSSCALYVCNPLLHQWVLLPSPPMPISSMDLPHFGFAFDGHHYTVVTFQSMIANLRSKIIACQIFYSKTGTWRKHQARVFSSPFQSVEASALPGSLHRLSLYWNQKIHWVLTTRKCMLVFCMEKELFEFIKLPSCNVDVDREEADPHGGWLWESGDQQLCYCYAGIDRIYMWTTTCIDVDDDNTTEGDYADDDYKWELKHMVMHETLKGVPIEDYYMRPNNTMFIPPQYVITTIQYCAFDHDSNLLYILMKPISPKYFGHIYCYSLDSGSVKVAWEVHDRGDAQPYSVYPYLFSYTELPKWDGCKLLLNL